MSHPSTVRLVPERFGAEVQTVRDQSKCNAPGQAVQVDINDRSLVALSAAQSDNLLSFFQSGVLFLAAASLKLSQHGTGSARK